MLNRLTLALCLSVVLGVLPLPGQTGTASAPVQRPIAGADPGSILVRFGAGVVGHERDLALAMIGGVVRREYTLVPGLTCVEVAAPVDDALASLGRLPGVLYAEPNLFVHPIAIPNDPSFSSQWGMHNTGQTGGTPDADIDAPEAWDVFTGDPETVVAVVDSGVNYLHPDLAANAWINTGEIAGTGVDDDSNGYVDDVRGWDFWNNDPDPMDDYGHGSYCAGIIGAVGNNGIGISGLNWRCKIMPVKFISSGGGATLDGALAAIEYAILNGAKISNHSWISLYAQALQDMVDAAQAAGHLLVAGSGNFGTDNDITPYYPASCENANVIAVGGVDSSDNPHGNYGVRSVDLVAPSVNVYSCWTSGYRFATGTSAAAPHVAGAATLLLGREPTLTYAQLRQAILRNTRKVPQLKGRVATGGELNVGRAIRFYLRPLGV